MITSSSLFKRMRWFTVLLLFAFSLPEEAQTSNIPDMIKIKADCFTMGSEEFVVEEPEHKVCLNSYYLMVHEVTLDKAGFYDYFCELHQAVMRGVFIVQPR